MCSMAEVPNGPNARRYYRLEVPAGGALSLGAQLRIVNEAGRFVLRQRGNASSVTLNGQLADLLRDCWLEVGDVVCVERGVVVAGRNILGINGVVASRARGTAHVRLIMDSGADACVPQAGELPRFFPAPRLAESVQPLVLEVDAPPQLPEASHASWAMRIGPSLAMGAASLVSAISSLARAVGGEDVLASIPSLSMALSMVAGALAWPLVSARAARRDVERAEMRRDQRYVSYLDGIENQLTEAVANQSRVLCESRPSIGVLMERAHSLSPLLMNRMAAHDDFMVVRVGTGDLDLLAELRWPRSHFSLQDDRMSERVSDLACHAPRLKGVPLVVDLAHHHVVGIIGSHDDVWDFMRGILVQACALYSYEEAKIVLIGDERDHGEWSHLSALHHLYGSDGRMRLVALTERGLSACDRVLCAEFDSRAQTCAQPGARRVPHYLVVCAHAFLAQRSAAVRRVLAQDADLGATLLYLGHSLADLPRECDHIIDLAPDKSASLRSLPRATSAEYRACMFERSDVADSLQWFAPDIMVTREEAHAFAQSLSRVRLSVDGHAASYPDTLGFLALLGVGAVEQLDIASLWEANDASHALPVPIGVDAHGNALVLDLHEAAHGPHGLIAGTTGSGKSELIITYVLAAATMYAPDEMAFVLIDYKGGGLTGAFDNAFRRLPHLAGTITNLDGATIHRSLVSIESELHRRQALFNRARAQTGEATMDIYKYLSYYRRGVLDEPCPHLVIIADEFAELKAQEPAFMDGLMSAARIGRSLGVHLVLATQKPTGVVSDQIWSNARFKLCLKVSDAADSREMIRTDDAAEIVQAGRFYLLVGYHEQYVCGQAAYAGSAYIARERCELAHDLSVELLGSEGETLARLQPRSLGACAQGTELDAVLSAIASVSDARGLQARQLWLAPLALTCTIDDLVCRYGPIPSDGLTCVVGELDDPWEQRQLRLDVNLMEVGNALLLGMPGSGADDVALAMLVSLAQAHASDELWLYALDGGAGALHALGGLAHCGGVVLASDDEDRAHVLRMLKQLIQKRRQARMDNELLAGRDDDLGSARAPHVVVCVTNLAALLDADQRAEEALVALTREGPDYGVHFVVTATPASVRPSLRSHFGFAAALMLDDRSGYAAVLGALPSALPVRAARRGLVSAHGRMLELQGATVAPDSAGAAKVIAGLAALHTGAPARPIPRLPTCVLPAHMGMRDSSAFPVGYAKDEVAPVSIDLARSSSVLVAGNDIDAIAGFLRGVHDAYAGAPCASWAIIDVRAALGVESDPHVLVDVDGACALVGKLARADAQVDVVVLADAVQALGDLPNEFAEQLQALIVGAIASPATFVIATEAWRAYGLYHDWWRVVAARNTGVWVGDGFSEQSVFRFARMEASFCAPANAADGFLIERGMVRAVRLLGQASARSHERGLL